MTLPWGDREATSVQLARAGFRHSQEALAMLEALQAAADGPFAPHAPPSQKRLAVAIFESSEVNWKRSMRHDSSAARATVMSAHPVIQTR